MKMLYKFILLLLFSGLAISSPNKLLTEKELINKELYFDISKAIENKENCYKLCLGGQKLTVLNDEICKLNKLQDLNLSQNEFFELPKEFGNLENLTELNLSGNKLVRLPETFVKLINLKNLDLSSLQHPDWENIFFTISQLSNIESLDLSFNKFPFHLLERLPSSIRKVYLSDTEIPNEFINNFQKSRTNIEIIK